MKTKEVQAMQARARQLLDELAGWMFVHGPHEQQFKGSHLSQQFAGKNVGMRNALTAMMGQEGAAIADELQAYTLTIYRILVSIARDEKVKDEDLDDLTGMQDNDAGPIRFKNSTSGLPYQRYSRVTEARSLSGHLADVLLEFMNLSKVYGRVHWICQRADCGTLMTGGRGGKKFCSPACRKAHWQAEQQRQLVNGRKKKARQYTKLIAKKKAAKGGRHGRPAPKK